jgi:tetratricopeptide (TPR) repeat protein
MKRPTHVVLASIAIAALFLFLPAFGWAQQQPGAEPVTPSDEQQKLNDEGVEHLIEENYARAVAHFEQSLLLGELNVTYLNLGRAYQKMGKCAKAKSALERALVAPPVANPPEKLVTDKAREYLAEVEQECVAEPAEAQPETAGMSSHELWGWTATAAGLAVAGTGVGLHFAAEGKRDEVREAQRQDGLITSVSQTEAQQLEDDANTLDSVGVAMIAAGLVGAGVGTYLMFTAPDEADASVSVGLSDDSIGLSFSGRF